MSSSVDKYFENEDDIDARMNIQAILEAKVKAGFSSLYETELPSVEFQSTRKDFEGDITVVVFPMLRYKKGNPVQIGQDLGNYLVENVEEIESFNVVKGFLNLVISDVFYLNFFNDVTQNGNDGLHYEKPKLFIGVDPGKTGFFTFWTESLGYFFHAMPYHKVDGKNEFNIEGFKEMFDGILENFNGYEIIVAIEQVGGRGGWSATNNFNFGYDMALHLKVRVTMIKLIRKEILAHGYRMWDLMLE